MALFKRDGPSSTIALFDIRSASVGAALVEMKEKPTVVYQTRLPLSFQEDLNFDHFMRSMLGVLLQASLRLQSEGLGKGGRKIDKISCVFSSPWFVSQTRILHTKKEHPFTITKRFIGECMEKAEEDFQSSELALNTENLNKKAALIENHIIQTVLNGYPVPQPYGREVQDVAIALFMSMISQDVLDKVEEIFEKTFNTSKIDFHSFALISFLAIRDLFQDDNNFLMVDISGEVSDVSIVYNDILYETASFPLGKNSIIRELGKKKKILPEEAHSKIKLSTENILANEKDNVMTGLEEKWLAELKNALKSLGDDLPLPQKMYVTADKDVSPWFESTIRKGDFSAVSYAVKPFIPVFLTRKELLSHVSFDHGSFDPFFAIETLFLERGV